MTGNKEIIDMIIKALIAVVSVLITSYLIPWLKTKAGAERMAEFYDFTEKCVQSAEKMFTAEQWESKKSYVLQLCSNRLEELDLNITNDELNAIIEGFVKAVKG